MSENNNQNITNSTAPLVTCDTRITFIIDESSSIEGQEIIDIKNGLNNFINAQKESNITLSFIGMSNRDNDLRTDHILEKKLKESFNLFESWINKYRNYNGTNGIDAFSDFWASGLERLNKSVSPQDIIIIITDGSEVSNLTLLQERFKEAFKKGHIFIYGLMKGWYLETEFRYPDEYFLKDILEIYFGFEPIPYNNNILNSHYVENIETFTELSNHLSNLSQALVEAQVGCTPNLEIIENKISPLEFYKGDHINQKIGSIKIQNKSRLPYALTHGTRIHQDNVIGGNVVYSLNIPNNSITIPGNASVEIEVYAKTVEGVSVVGNYSPPIYIDDKVKNLQDLKIVMTIKEVVHNLQIIENRIQTLTVDNDDELANIPVGSIVIRNNTTYAYTLQANTKIHSSLTLGGLEYRIKDVITIEGNQQASVNIIVSGKAGNVGNYQEKIYINDVIKNLNDQHKINLIVNQFVYDLTITDSTLQKVVGFRGYQYDEIAGTITIVNNSKRSYILLPNPIHTQIQNIAGLVFFPRTITGHPVIPSFSTATIPIKVSGEINKIGNFSELITIDNVKNPSGFRIEVESKEVIKKVDIIESKLSNLAFVLDKPITKQTVGSILVVNRGNVPYTIEASTQIHKITALNGLKFTTYNKVELQPGGSSFIIIEATGTPTLKGIFSTAIYMNEFVFNPYNYKIQIIVAKGSGTEVDTRGDSYFQSSFLYLQTAGSIGEDSTKGIHTRWMLRGKLGENHIPKGNAAIGTNNFNKSNDYVTIHRAPYIKIKTTLDLAATPTKIDDKNRFWIYTLGDSKIPVYVYFRNNEQYDSTRRYVDPTISPIYFIENYGDELIEIDTKENLFFAGRFESKRINNQSGKVQLEVLSVSENKLIAAKTVSFRKTFGASIDIENTPIEVENSFETTALPPLTSNGWLSENGRSIRYKCSGTYITKIDFEFYSIFINLINKIPAWQKIGQYSLSLNDTEVYSALEPITNVVNGKWLRYNDGSYVNIQNYKNKWSRRTIDSDKNLKEIVTNYITLSNAIDNPKANEQFYLTENDGGIAHPDDIVTFSYLDILRMSAYDYHIARMLGLGALDLSNDIMTGEYVYLAEYTTLGDLGNGNGKTQAKHFYMSLPTSLADDRLPNGIDLDRIEPGLYDANSDLSTLTDKNGYTKDGKKRFVTLFSKYLEETLYNRPFYENENDINLSSSTDPMYVGIEYRLKDQINWVKPEISHDKSYTNVDREPDVYETIPLLIPEYPKSLYVHEHNSSGVHQYGTYSINWFSRANRSNVVKEITSTIRSNSFLTPPYEITPFFISEEKPLMFTSKEEQKRYSTNTLFDKTIIRIPFNYDSNNEVIEYKVSDDVINPLDENSIFPDKDEVFANQVEILYRDSLPKEITGKIIEIKDDPSNPIISIIRTGTYTYLSSGETVMPYLPTTSIHKYLGGVIVIGKQPYIIHNIESNSDGNNPTFYVYKKIISDGIIQDEIPTIDNTNLISPEITNDGLFYAIENIQNLSTWNNSIALPLKISIGDNRADFKVHREVIYRKNDEGELEKVLEKSRGFWQSAKIEKEEEVVNIKEIVNDAGEIIQVIEKGFKGLYKVTFSNFILSQHSQYSNSTNSVEWWNGVLRLFTKDCYEESGNACPVPIKSRKAFKVLRTENISSNNSLILYVEDPLYTNESTNIILGDSILVNYYPNYKVYLYANDSYGLNSKRLLPKEGEGTKYVSFSMQSFLNKGALKPSKSKIATPVPMFIRESIKAQIPETSKGALYATRPDFHGRSTYSFTTEFKNKPHGLLIARSNDELLLNALYSESTVKIIRENLALLGGNNEIFFTNRWNNFLDYETLKKDGKYKRYPQNNDFSFEFPLPDNNKLFNEINAFIKDYNEKTEQSHPLISQDKIGKLLLNVPIIKENNKNILLIDFVFEAIYYSFIPLTEMPVIYDHIPGVDHQPVDEKQVIKDENGYALLPTDPRFKMAPMMKIASTTPKHSILFTDFHLDGYSNNIYFYGVREVSSQMKFGNFNTFLGPIKLINSLPPEAPEVVKISPVLKNDILGISPHITIQINQYAAIQNIKQINVYRTFDPLEAQSIRTMKKIKSFEVDDSIFDDNIWQVKDELNNLDEIRYGDGIYYRITVSRGIEYEENNQKITDYASSHPSKIIATLLVDNEKPLAPKLNYSYQEETINELKSVKISWNKVVYNGKYILYKLSENGNWERIMNDPITSNEPNMIIDLSKTTLLSPHLKIKDANNNPIYHHFKLVVENTSGLQSVNEEILTIHNGPNGNKNGIGFMKVGSTFIINSENELIDQEVIGKMAIENNLKIF